MRSISRVARVSAQRSVSFRKISVIAAFAAIALCAVAVYSSSSSAANLSTYIFGLVSNSGSASPLAATPNPITFEAESVVTAQAPVVNGNLQAARSGHTATKLDNGGVLIVGGESTGSAEIYDALNNVSASTGTLNTPRSGHTATKLSDGRVLIAGGSGDSSTEIYDPANGTFSAGPAMTTARSGHTATLLANGSVFIAGGGNDTAEIFDGTTFTAVSATMSASRTNASAVQMNNGRIFIAGGDGSSSAEIFDPASGSFSTVGNAMTMSRSRALLRVLPDGKVQIIGGNSDGSMEVYDPSIDTIGAYAHVVPESDPCAGLINYVLSAQTRSALIFGGSSAPERNRSGFTVTELGSSALLIGGSDGSGATGTVTSFSSSSATITTDKLDYQPGDTATISGTGYAAGETVRVMIHEDPHTPQERGFDATADASGNFTGIYLVQDYDLNMKFIAGARGLTSGNTAQTTFTDAKNVSINFAGNGSGTVTSTSSPTSSPQFNCTSTSGTESGTCDSVSFDNNAVITLTAAPAANSSMGSWTVPAAYTIQSGCLAGNTSCKVDINNTAGTIVVGFNANAAIVTPATGGTAISADTTGGTYTTLTGPVLSENGTAQIGTGTIILNAPSGFIFDTGGAAPTVQVGCLTAPCVNTTNINNITSGNSFAITTRTTTQITITITDVTSSSELNSLTWQNIRVRPSAGTPLASGNITQTGSSVIAGGVSSPNFGTLTEIPGAANKLAFLQQPTNAAKDATITPAVTVRILDQFNNHVTTSTRNVALAIGTNPAGGTLTGGGSIPAVGGTATFSGLSINNAGTGYTLVASSAGSPTVTNATSTAFDIAKLNQTITVTTPAPASAIFGQSFNVAATASSGLAVAITTTGGCSGSGSGSASITMTSGTTSCVVHYNQAGNTNYNAASEVTSTTTAVKAATSIVASSATGTYGGQVTLTATLTRTSVPSGVLSGKTVNFTLNGNSVGSNVTNVSGVASVTVFLTSNGLVGGTRINAGSFPTGVGASFTTDNDFIGSSDTDSLTVNQKSVTASVTASNKVYNGNNTATIATCTPAPLESGDTVTCTAVGPNTFNNKNAGIAKPVSATNISLGGGSAANYVLSSTSAATTADILTKAITATLVAANKGYDGNTTEPDANMSCSFAGLIPADVLNVSCTQSAGTFNTPNVLTANLVTATVTIGGTEGGNYTLGADGSIQNSTSASASASITARTLTASIIGNPTKPYDGNTNATLTPANFSLATLVAAESFTVTKTTGFYNDANVALANSVSTTLVAGDFTPGAGTLASNYNLPISASGAGSISQATSTTVVSCPSNVTYTGAALTPCTVLVSGAGGLSLTPTANYSNNINAGTASASYTYAGDANHTGSSDSKNFTIDQAASVTTVTCPASVTYTGSAIEPCMYTVTGAGGLNIGPTAVPPGNYSNNTDVGTATASYTFAGDANHTGSSDSKTFDITQAPTTTVIDCSPGSFVYTGSAIEPCTATVTGVNAFSQTVPVTYTDNTNVGTAKANASFGGNLNYAASTADQVTFQITPSATSISVSPATGTYGGTVDLSATLNRTSVPTGPLSGKTVHFFLNENEVGNALTDSNGVALLEDVYLTSDGEVTGTRINAGTYTPLGVGASFTAELNYSGSSDNDTLTVNQKPVTPSVTATNKTYNASDAATVTCSVAAYIETGDTLTCEAGGPNTFSDANAANGKTVTARNISLGGASQANYVLTSTEATTTANIFQAVADCSSIVGYTGIYDANPHSATGTCTGVDAGGAALGSTLNLGASFTNYPGGTANWSFVGGTNYTNQSGSVNITINKADAVCTVSGYTGIYDGNAHGATGSCTGVASETMPTIGSLDLGGQFTNVPGGTANWSFTGTNNYNNQSGTASIVINKADAICTITGFSGVYNGNPHGATGQCTGVGGSSDILGGLLIASTTYTNVPGGLVHWTFTNSNYNDQSGDAQVTITKANANCVVNGYGPLPYDANPHGATGQCTGVGGVSDVLNGLDLGAPFTNVPGGTAHWVFTDVTGNYYDQSGDVSIAIVRANATISVNGYSDEYDGDTHGASGTATGVGGVDLSSLFDFGETYRNVPGGSANWTFNAGYANNNYNSTSGSVDIIITAKNLTISGAVADNKIYNGDNSATVNFTAASLVGVISPDVVSIDSSGYSATFDNENVGENKPVTVIGVTLGGVNAGNYTVSQPTGLTAKITKKSITIAGALAHDKPYDGNTNAAISFPNSPEGLASEVLGDDVGFNAAGYTAHFADKNVGTWAVTVTGIVLTGLDAGNYELIQPQGLTASITPASLTASIVGDPTRAYNGDVDASLTSGNFDIFGLAPGEDFNVNQTAGTYNDKDVVDAHTVTASLAALNFVPANVDTLSTNYSYPTSASGPGHITPATPTVNIHFADAPSTVYNGLTHPASVTVTGVLLEGVLSIPTSGTVAITYLKSGNPSGEPVNAGSYSASAFFDSANSNYTDASSGANALLTIDKANAAVVVTPYHVDYDGDPHTATVSSITGVNGESNATVGTVDLSATTHTNAGTYNDTWSFTGTANYNDQLNVPITNVIEKATTFTVVAFEAGPYVYRGSAFIATAQVTGPAGLNVAVTPVLYSGDCTNVTTANGCTASATYAETANYKTSSDSKSITITKANALCSINGYGPLPYDANPHGATGSCTGVAADPAAGGSSLNLGAQFTDVPGGTAHWAFTGGANYADQSGDVAIEITKADAAVVINDYNGVYDANPHGVTGTATGVSGANLSAGLALGGTFTNVPGGTVNWAFSGGTNYQDESGTANVNISPADANVTVNGYSGTYDAAAHGATGSALGVNDVDLSSLLALGDSFTNVPGGTAHWTFNAGSANANYVPESGSVAITIGKANANCASIVGYTGQYDALPHGATGGCSGVDAGGAALGSSLNLGSQFTDVPGGTAHWVFTGGTNYNDQGDDVAIVISQAPSVTDVTCVPNSVVYTGSPHTHCGVSVTGIGGLNLSPTPSYSDNTNVGTATASYSYTGDLNHSGSSDSATFSITPATTTTVITCPSSVIYNGDPQTPCTAAATGAGPLNVSVAVVHANNTNVGTATADASYAGDANHTGSTASQVTFQITPASSTTVVTCPPSVTYNGSAHTPCSASVSGAGGLSQSLTVNYSNNTNAGTASASASYPGDSNHTGSSDSKNFTIDKAPTTTTVTCPVSVMYNGFAQTPCSVSVKRNGPPAVQIGTPTPSYSANQNVGTATASYTFAGDANHLASAPASANFQITQAPLTITAVNKSKIFGTTVTFDTTTPSTDFTVATLLGSDTVSSVTMSSTGAPAAAFAGSHPILISAAVGSGLGNYNIAYVQGTIVVGGYVFDGFKSPIENTTTNVIVWNKANGGQAIPTKWRLTLNGSPVSALSSFVALQSFEVNCNSGVSIDADNIPDEGVTPGSADLTYQGDGNFHFNWKTPKSYNNQCRMMWVLFLDGSKSPFAYFKFK